MPDEAPSIWGVQEQDLVNAANWIVRSAAVAGVPMDSAGIMGLGAAFVALYKLRAGTDARAREMLDRTIEAFWEGTSTSDTSPVLES